MNQTLSAQRNALAHIHKPNTLLSTKKYSAKAQIRRHPELTSLTSLLFMNLSLVLWQVWMQFVMYKWMNSDGRSTAWEVWQDAQELDVNITVNPY